MTTSAFRTSMFFSPSTDGGGGGGTVSNTDLLNGIAYNTMMILDLHDLNGQTIGGSLVTAFESNAAGTGNASTYESDGAGVNPDTWESTFAGSKSVGSIAVSGDSDSVVETLTVGGDELLSGDVTPFGDTAYDGTGDYYIASTGGAALKIAGAQTWCCRAIINTTQVDAFGGFLSNRDTSSQGGIELNYKVAGDVIQCYIYHGGGIDGFEVAAPSKDVYHDYVVLYDGSSVKLYIDGSLAGTDASITALTTATEEFHIGSLPINLARALAGSLADIEIYSGAVTDATLWEPGNPSSMTRQGGTLVLQCYNGNGTNDEGITFTENGNPVYTAGDRLMEALCTGVSKGPENADWDANYDTAGASGTLTLTAANVGDNNEKAILGDGTDVTFSGAVDTRYGAAISPTPEAPSVGSIDVADGLTTTSVSSLTLGGDELLSGTVTPYGYTTYNGSTDWFYSNDAALRHTGAQIWAAEIWVDPSVATNTHTIMSNNLAGGEGIDFYYWGNTNSIYFSVRAATATTINVALPAKAQWLKVIGLYDGTNVQLWFDGSVVATTPLLSAFVTSTAALYIGGLERATTEVWDGRMRNVEMYAGTASNPGLWVPGDTSSMTGQASEPTLLMALPSGNEVNNQGLTFSTAGAPVTTGDDIMTALKDDINANQTDWDVTISATGPAGRLTLTAAANGSQNDGKSPDATGSDVAFSRKTDTVGGSVGVHYTGFYLSTILDMSGSTITRVHVTFAQKWRGATSGTVGTDMVVEATRNGTQWAAAPTVTNTGATMAGTEYKYYEATCTVSGQSAGTDIQVRLRDTGPGNSEWFALSLHALED